MLSHGDVPYSTISKVINQNSVTNAWPVGDGAH